MYISAIIPSLAVRAITSDHPFVAAGEGDSRSPCPALNALANHGFIAHDGKNIAPTDLIGALNTVLGMDQALAQGLVGQALGCCSKSNTTITSLADVGIHNGIEHDASLVHDDVLPGQSLGSSVTNQTLLEELVSGKEQLTKEDFAAARVRREATLAAPLDPTHRQLAQGEPVLAMLALSDGGPMSVETARTFFGQDKLPDNFTSSKNFTAANVAAFRTEIGKLMDDLVNQLD